MNRQHDSVLNSIMHNKNITKEMNFMVFQFNVKLRLGQCRQVIHIFTQIDNIRSSTVIIIHHIVIAVLAVSF